MKLQQQFNLSKGFFEEVRFMTKVLMLLVLAVVITDLIGYILLFHDMDVVWFTLVESVGIMFSAVIFLATFYAFVFTRRVRTVILSMIFLSVTIFDLIYLLAFLGTSHDSQSNFYLSQTFYFLGRITKAIGMLVFALLNVQSITSKRRAVFTVPAGLITVLTALGLLLLSYCKEVDLNFILQLFYGSSESTSVLVGSNIIRWLIILCYSSAGLLLLKEYLSTHELYIKYMVMSLTFSIASHLNFLFLTREAQLFYFIPFIFRVGAGYLLFKAIFVCYVQKPYSELQHARDKNMEHAGKLEEVVNERTQEMGSINSEIIKDLEVAKSIQKAILPQRHIVMEDIEICIEYRPCQTLGGDFCGVFKLDEDRIGIYIGDVSGHGVPAAMLTMFLNQTILSVLHDSEYSGNQLTSPSGVLAALNNAFNDSSFEDDMYIALFYAVYSITTKEIVFSSAGLNTVPLLLRADGMFEFLRIQGYPICKLAGLIPNEYEEKSKLLQQGDRLILYTDGITDCNDLQNNSYGQGRLCAAVSTFINSSPNEALKGVIIELDKYSEGVSFKDDITIMIIDVK